MSRDFENVPPDVPHDAPPGGEHDDAVAAVPIDATAIEAACELLRAISHPHRLSLLIQLQRHSRSVGWLAQQCGIPHHSTSEHLRLMQRCDLIQRRRQGRFAVYRLHHLGLRRIIETIDDAFAVRRR